jgi:hypothetical protein
MSFDPLIKALEENPALAEEIGNAKTPRERDAILDAHGIEKPNLDSKFPEVDGGVDGKWGRGSGYGEWPGGWVDEAER